MRGGHALFLHVQAAAQQAAQQALQQHQQGHSLPDLHNAGRQSQLLALLKEKQQAQAQQQLAALQQQRQHAAAAAASIGGGGSSATGQTQAHTSLGQPASPKGLPSAGSPGPGMGTSPGGAVVAGGGGAGGGSIDDIAVYVAAIKEVMASEDVNKPQVLQQLSTVLKQAVQVGDTVKEYSSVRINRRLQWGGAPAPVWPAFWAHQECVLHRVPLLRHVPTLLRQIGHRGETQPLPLCSAWHPRDACTCAQQLRYIILQHML